MSAPEYEAKYLIRRPNLPFALAWLRARCRQPAEHAANRVFSLYFDTPAGEMLAAKANGDFRKLKVRLRWYGAVDADSGQPPVFIEAKGRRGATRTKQRLLADAAHLLGPGVPDLHGLRRLIEQARPQLGLPAGLEPVLSLSFRRQRFVAASSGARVNLDDEISAIWRRPGCAARAAVRVLGQAVLEIKDTGREVPTELLPMVRWVARRGSFSKYHALMTEGTAA